MQKLYHLNKKRTSKVAHSGLRKERDCREERQPARSRNEPTSYSRGREQDESRGVKSYPSAPVSQPSYSNKTKSNFQQITYPCNDHPEEELTYYCFTCNRPICPECAIHGLHRDHEVQTTRKAIKQIKQLLIEDRTKLDQEMNEIATNREQAKRLSKEWQDENKRDQEFIRKKLTQLKALVSEKEKELLRGCDTNLERNVEILRNEATASDRTLDSIAGVKRNIDQTLKKEDLTVLQEFNKRDEEANEAMLLGDR